VKSAFSQSWDISTATLGPSNRFWDQLLILQQKIIPRFQNKIKETATKGVLKKELILQTKALEKSRSW